MSASGMAIIDGLFFFLLTILEQAVMFVFDIPLLERVCGLLLESLLDEDCCLGWAASLLVSKLLLSRCDSLRNVVFFTVSQFDRFGVAFRLFAPLVSLFDEWFVPLRLRT